MRYIQRHLLYIIVLIAFFELTGCSTTQTPSWLRIVHWKKEKTKLDLAIDHYEKGQKYEAAGERQKAIEEYNTAQKLSPRPIVYYKLGLLYAAEGNYSLAKTDFQKALQLDPDFKEARKELDTLQVNTIPISTDTTSNTGS